MNDEDRRYLEHPHATETSSVPAPDLSACPVCGNALLLKDIDSYPKPFQDPNIRAVGYIDLQCAAPPHHRFLWRFRAPFAPGQGGLYVESIRLLDRDDLQVPR